MDIDLSGDRVPVENKQCEMDLNSRELRMIAESLDFIS